MINRNATEFSRIQRRDCPNSHELGYRIVRIRTKFGGGIVGIPTNSATGWWEVSRIPSTGMAGTPAGLCGFAVDGLAADDVFDRLYEFRVLERLAQVAPGGRAGFRRRAVFKQCGTDDHLRDRLPLLAVAEADGLFLGIDHDYGRQWDNCVGCRPFTANPIHLHAAWLKDCAQHLFGVRDLVDNEHSWSLQHVAFLRNLFSNKRLRLTIRSRDGPSFRGGRITRTLNRVKTKF